jgi:hypothetical protein
VLQKIIRSEINTLTEEQKDVLHIHIDDIKVQLFLKRCILKGVEVHSIDTIPSKLNHAFRVSLDRLIIKLDGFFDVYKGGKLKLKSLDLQEPTIDFTYKVRPDSLPEKTTSSFKINAFSELELESIEVSNGQFHLKKYKDTTLSLVSTVSDVDMQMEDITLNLNEEKVEQKLNFDKIQFNLGNTIFYDAEKHDISFGNIVYNSNQEGLRISEFEFRNKISRELFEQNNDLKEPYFDSKLKDLKLVIDFKRLKEKELFFKTIDINYLDLIFSLHHKDTSDFSLKKLLNNIPLPFGIDTLSLDNSNIDLFILDPKGENDDYMVNNLQMELQYISNDSIYNMEHPEIKGSVKSKLWKSGSIETMFSYNVSENKSQISLLANGIPQRKIKKYLADYKKIDFKNGEVASIDLDLIKDSIHFEGKLSLLIKDVALGIDHFPSSSDFHSMSTSLQELKIKTSFYKENTKAIDLYVDSLLIVSPRLSINAKSQKHIKNKKSDVSSDEDDIQALISVDYLEVNNASFNFKENGASQEIMTIDKAKFTDRSLVLDLSKEGLNKIINAGFYTLDLSHIELFQSPSYYFSSKNIHLNKKENKMDIIGFRFKNKSSKANFHNSNKEGNDWYSGYIESVNVDIDLNKLLKKEVYCSEIKLVKPILTYIKAIDRDESQAVKSNLDIKLPITIDEIQIVDADIDFRIKKEKEKEFEVFDLSDLNGNFENFKINKTTTGGNSLFTGSFESSFYRHSKMKLSIAHDFKIKNARTDIKGSAKRIELMDLVEKFSFLKSIPIKGGDLSSIDFELKIKDKQISGKVQLDSLGIEKYQFSPNQRDGDWISIKTKQIGIDFKHSEKDQLHFSSVDILEPEFLFHNTLLIKNDKMKKQLPSALFADKGKFVSKSKVDKFILKDGVYKQFKGATDQSPLFTIQNINLEGNNVELYDSTNTKLPISVSGLNAGFNNIVVHSLPNYKMSIDHFSLDLKSNKANIKNLSFKNKLPVDQFFKTLKYRKSYMDLNVAEMEIDVEFHALFNTHPHISKVQIDDAIFTTLVNVDLEQSPEEKPFPNRVLADSKFPITVDSILVKNSQLNIHFKENKTKFGLLQFNDVDASVSNLCSDPHQVKLNNKMVWDFRANLWETGKSHVVVNFELESENDDFSMYGKCDDLLMTDSDTLTANLYGIKVNDGILHHTYFELKGNNDELEGEVSFDYENLKVSLDKKKKKNIKNPDEMQKVKEKDKLSQSFVKSMIVNGLISKKNLPEKSNYIAEGHAYYKREKNKPIFHLMWFSLSSGILEIVEAGVVRDIRSLNNIFKKKKTEE